MQLQPRLYIFIADENGHLQVVQGEPDIKIEKEMSDLHNVTSDRAVATIAASAVRISVKSVSSNGSKLTAIEHPKPSKEEKERGRTENSLAVIMMVYVLIFLICHSPRLLLNLHELTTIR